MYIPALPTHQAMFLSRGIHRAIQGRCLLRQAHIRVHSAERGIYLQLNLIQVAFGYGGRILETLELIFAGRVTWMIQGIFIWQVMLPMLQVLLLQHPEVIRQHMGEEAMTPIS